MYAILSTKVWVSAWYLGAGIHVLFENDMNEDSLFTSCLGFHCKRRFEDNDKLTGLQQNIILHRCFDLVMNGTF